MTTGTSPLQSLHTRAGAHMTDFNGWQMPLRFDSDRAEHEAVRTSAGLFDLSHMAQIEVSGPEAGEAVDMSFIGPPSALSIGRARYTMMVDAEGGILDDLIVYRLAQDDYLIVANAANHHTVLDQLLLRSQNYGCAVEDRGSSRALIALQGPHAEAVLNVLTDADLQTLKYFACTSGTVAGIPVLLARTGYTGEDGFELSLPAASAAELWQALQETGESAGLVPCGLACRDSLRLEAGMALYGQELTREITPQDVGMAGLVRDHEFVGRRALQRRAEEGPQYYLTGLRGTGRRAARSGYTVSHGGQEIGEVTSGILSPTLGYPIALTRVTEPLGHGDEVSVDIRGTATAMTVTPVPFYRRQKPSNTRKQL